MHKNLYWLMFLFLVGATTVWYVGVFAYHFYHHFQFDTGVSPTHIEWTVKAFDESRWVLVAEYSFAAQGMIYHGETVFKRPVFRNLWAANHNLEKYRSQQWTVWFSARDPHDSTVQKSFPLKEGLYAGVLVLLWFYFLGLGYYVTLMDKAKKR